MSLVGIFSNLIVQNSLAAAAFFSIGILLFAYRKHAQKNPLIVSSNFFLKQLSIKKIKNKKIKLPLRFFLEALAFLLLTLSLLQLALIKERDLYALVIDNSFSMRALETNGTRLSLAKERAALWLDALPAGAYIEIFRSSPNISPISDKKYRKAAAKRALSSILPTYFPDALGKDLKLFDRGKYKDIFIVSDKQGLGNELNQVKTIGSSRENVFIISSRIESGEIFLSVGLSSNKMRVIEVVAYNETLNGQVIGREKFFFQANETSEVSLKPNIDTPGNDIIGPSVIRLELKPTSFSDAIASDNTAWLSTLNVRKKGILLVTPQNSENALGLEKLKQVKTQLINAKDYQALNSSQLSAYSLIIFHLFVPPELPNIPILFVIPKNSSKLFKVIDKQESIQISSWLETHPLMTYLNVPLISPPSSISFRSSELLTEVISSEFGALLVSEQQGENRFVVCGFELFPYEGKDTPSVSVLTVNIIKWLQDKKQLSAQRKTGELYFPETDFKEIIDTPEGRTYELGSATERKSLLLESPGIYISQITESNKLDLFPVNIANESESSTFSQSFFSLPNFSNTTFEKSPANKQLWKYFIVLALVLLFFDISMRQRINVR